MKKTPLFLLLLSLSVSNITITSQDSQELNLNNETRDVIDTLFDFLTETNQDFADVPTPPTFSPLPFFAQPDNYTDAQPNGGYGSHNQSSQTSQDISYPQWLGRFYTAHLNNNHHNSSSNSHQGTRRQREANLGNIMRRPRAANLIGRPHVVSDSDDDHIQHRGRRRIRTALPQTRVVSPDTVLHRTNHVG